MTTYINIVSRRRKRFNAEHVAAILYRVPKPKP